MLAYPTSRRSVPPVASVFNRGDQAAIQIKSIAESARASAQANTLTSSEVLDGVLDTCVRGRAVLLEASAHQGIAAHAQAQYADIQGLNIGAEFTAMIAAIDSVIAWIFANYPREAATGSLRAVRFVDSGGVLEGFTFTPTQETAFIAVLDPLIAAID